MTQLAPTLQAFFTERLIGQRQASPHTVAAYRDTFRLLFTYMRDTTGKRPDQLSFEDLDAVTIGGFLTHLEQERGVSAATRNARLAAVHSLFNYAAFRHPELSKDRAVFDRRWAVTIEDVVREGQGAGEFGEIDVEEFAISFAALMDGLSIQVALDDEIVDSTRALAVAMGFAARALGFTWVPPGRAGADGSRRNKDRQRSESTAPRAAKLPRSAR